jgi:hypothetical protein
VVPREDWATELVEHLGDELEQRSTIAGRHCPQPVCEALTVAGTGVAIQFPELAQ